MKRIMECTGYSCVYWIYLNTGLDILCHIIKKLFEVCLIFIVKSVSDIKSEISKNKRERTAEKTGAKNQGIVEMRESEKV